MTCHFVTSQHNVIFSKCISKTQSDNDDVRAKYNADRLVCRIVMYCDVTVCKLGSDHVAESCYSRNILSKGMTLFSP